MNSNENIPLFWAYNWLTSPKRQYINGEWVDGASDVKWVVTNPANREALCSFEIADADQVEYTATMANQCHRAYGQKLAAHSAPICCVRSPS